VFNRPDTYSDTILILNGYTLSFPQSKNDIWLGGMIMWGYDQLGFPILSFKDDSTWVKVFVCSSDSGIPSIGWIQLKKPGQSVIIWSEYLSTRCQYFIDEKQIAFYSRPDKNSKINVIGYEIQED
jgi:hypothetical protein